MLACASSLLFGANTIAIAQVQCGFARTGDYFAINGHFDVVPDILVMAKGIADGYPLSGIASRKELTDTQPPGSMGGTYAGNAVACAAALAVQDVIKEENVLQNVHERGSQIRAGLEKLKASGKYPIHVSATLLSTFSLIRVLMLTYLFVVAGYSRSWLDDWSRVRPQDYPCRQRQQGVRCVLEPRLDADDDEHL